MGVSDTEIRSGMIAMEGMVAGNYLIVPGVRSVQAAAAAINDRGGIYGRRVKVFECEIRPTALKPGPSATVTNARPTYAIEANTPATHMKDETIPITG